MGYPPRLSPVEVAAVHGAACSLASVFFVASADEMSTSLARGRHTPLFARQVAMYLAHINGVSLETVGSLWGRTASTVHFALAVVENARDDADLDALLDLLNTAVTVHRRVSKLLYVAPSQKTNNKAA